MRARTFYENPEPTASPTEATQQEGLHFNCQKFQKDPLKLEQLLLSEGRAMDAPENQQKIEVTGLNFSAPQLRSVAALYYLLDRTNFQGNMPPEPEREYEASHFRGSLPKITSGHMASRLKATAVLIAKRPTWR